jgi:hypothetical protein
MKCGLLRLGNNVLIMCKCLGAEESVQNQREGNERRLHYIVPWTSLVNSFFRYEQRYCTHYYYSGQRIDLRCNLDSPSSDCSRFRFVRSDAMHSRSFLRLVQNSTAMNVSVCTHVFQVSLYCLCSTPAFTA